MSESQAQPPRLFTAFVIGWGVIWRAIPAMGQPAPIVLDLPIAPACVSSPFGPRDAAGPFGPRNAAGPFGPRNAAGPFGPRDAAGPLASHFHTGIDIPAPAGAWVQTAAAGTVVAIRRRGAAGLEMEVRHAGGWTTRYDHLGTVAPAFMAGKRAVARGDRLGRIGRTGVTYGTHLHFELLINGVRADPAAVLALTRCSPPRPDAAPAKPTKTSNPGEP